MKIKFEKRDDVSFGIMVFSRPFWIVVSLPFVDILIMGKVVYQDIYGGD